MPRLWDDGGMIMGLASGKYNKKRWVPYDAAKTIVQEWGGITSRSKYWKWHDKEKPPHLPKYPNRVYPEFKGWNDYLGVDNSFEREKNRKKKLTRPFWEAVRWAQAQGYKTSHEYKDAYTRGEVPDDIPKQPESFYKAEWKGWGVFLGTNIRSRVMSKSEDLGILVLCTIKNQAGNMFEVVVDDNGIASMQQRLAARADLQPFKAYYYRDEDKVIVQKILEKHASNQGGNVYIAVSLNDVTFQFDTNLEIYRP